MSARGFSRFRGGGSLWKTSWRGKVPLTEMCCISGFEGGQFYISPNDEPGNDLLPLDFVNGSWFAFVVGITDPPTPGSYQGIARGSSTGSGAWDLSFTSNGPSLADGLLFRLRLNVGLPTEMSFGGTQTIILDDPSQAQLGREIFFRIFVQAIPPFSGVPNGAIRMVVERQFLEAATPLVNPYLSPSVGTFVGIASGRTDPIAAPNCIHGLVSGTSQSLIDPLSTSGAAVPFFDSIEAEYQITEPPPFDEAGQPAVGFSVNYGWRANNPPLPDAPAQWEPYVGAQVLVYGSPESPPLDVQCGQAVFAQEAA